MTLVLIFPVPLYNSLPTDAISRASSQVGSQALDVCDAYFPGIPCAVLMLNLAEKLGSNSQSLQYF